MKSGTCSIYDDKAYKSNPKQQIITLTFVVKHTSGGVRASGLTTYTPWFTSDTYKHNFLKSRNCT